ncbi:hypothetical protein G7Z17_g683 [Cylindrodendrum hubeiense]|uniref:Uncharacterized protein n=1 Tax=Cylindrodendrum hubeiense TaxID=595255 RepID=A0A9P5HJQ6_9HYPO|nr:hypothetical protein G7Z17_g683 [Cylindrodendrum hubeiense]
MFSDPWATANSHSSRSTPTLAGMSRVRGLRCKSDEKGVQVTVPASSASVQELRSILDGSPSVVDQYSIKLRADVYKVSVEGPSVELQNLFATFRR